MNCKCGGETIVIDVRWKHGMRQRRRECKICGYKINTVEVQEVRPRNENPRVFIPNQYSVVSF